MRQRALFSAFVFLAACAPGPKATRASTVVIPSATPRPPEARRSRASELFATLCGGPVESARALEASCSPATPETAGSWVLLGDLAKKGRLPHTSEREGLAIADAAYLRAIRSMSPSAQPLYAQSMFDLASVRDRERRPALALSGFLQVVENIDLERESRPAVARDLEGLRDLALHWATIVIVNERDWDGDGVDDSTQGLERPEVKKVLDAFLSDRNRADFYARLVPTAAGDENPQSFPVVVDCPLATKALEALRAATPTDSRALELTAKAAACR